MTFDILIKCIHVKSNVKCQHLFILYNFPFCTQYKTIHVRSIMQTQFSAFRSEYWNCKKREFSNEMEIFANNTACSTTLSISWALRKSLNKQQTVAMCCNQKLCWVDIHWMIVKTVNWIIVSAYYRNFSFLNRLFSWKRREMLVLCLLFNDSSYWWMILFDYDFNRLTYFI